MTLQQEVEASGTDFLLQIAASTGRRPLPGSDGADTGTEGKGMDRKGGEFKAGEATASGGRELEELKEVESSAVALFGGAQYHRLVREFAAAVSALPAVPIPPEEVINSMGIDAGVDPLHVSRHRSDAQSLQATLIPRSFDRLEDTLPLPLPLPACSRIFSFASSLFLLLSL